MAQALTSSISLLRHLLLRAALPAILGRVTPNTPPSHSSLSAGCGSPSLTGVNLGGQCLSVPDDPKTLTVTSSIEQPITICLWINRWKENLSWFVFCSCLLQEKGRRLLAPLSKKGPFMFPCHQDQEAGAAPCWGKHPDSASENPPATSWTPPRACPTAVPTLWCPRHGPRHELFERKAG